MLAVLAFAVCLLSGCSVLEEIKSLGGDEVAAEGGSDEGCEKDSQNEACPKTANGWSNVTSLSSDQMKADIVSCRLGDATQFMIRDRCIARGGTPAG